MIQHGKKRKEELFSEILFKKQKASIDLNSIKKLTKSDVVELFKKEIPLDDDDLSKIGNLKGPHLSTLSTLIMMSLKTLAVL